LLERENFKDSDKKLKRAQQEIAKLRDHIDLLNNDNKLRIQQFEMNLDQINTEKRQMIEKNKELSNQINALCSELESEQYANQKKQAELDEKIFECRELKSEVDRLSHLELENKDLRNEID